MAKKIVLDAEQFTVPLDKLVASPKNVRKTYSPEEIEEMAASIAVKNRGLLQNLGITEQVDEAGEPTGLWEVVAGGRRWRGLKLLVERKRLSPTAPIPCRKVAREEAVDASLAENEQRRALHPADAYEAFAALHRGGKGVGVEEIAARHGVSPHTVRQRLRLGTVAPVVLAAYREGELTLDHVMAFTVNEDQTAQERAYQAYRDMPAWQRTADMIRRLLTKASIPAYDPRARLVGLDAYRAAGGQVQRDLFTEDEGGWLVDVALLEQLVAERVRAVTDRVRAEGWKWVETDREQAHKCWYTSRRVWPVEVALPEADAARRDELAIRFDGLAADHPNGAADAPEEVRAELERIERELDALEEREHVFRPEDVARGGATITLTGDGALRVERGYVRPEDEPRPEQDPEPESEGGAIGAGCGGGDDEGAEMDDGGASEAVTGAVPSGGDGAPIAAGVEKAPALTADLDAELSTHRTAALRAEIMGQPDLALRVLAHALATATFYGGHRPTVARIGTPYGGGHGVGTGDSPARRAIKAAEDEQKAKLPPDHGELWAWLLAQDVPAIHALLAVCTGRVAEAQGGDWTEAAGARHVCAQAARRAGLDMRRWWGATRASYLGRVTKAGILAAVREGAGEDAARRIEGMKKDAMAENAEELLTGKGWLPHRLRVPAAEAPAPTPAPDAAEGAGIEGQEARAEEVIGYPAAAE